MVTSRVEGTKEWRLQIPQLFKAECERRIRKEKIEADGFLDKLLAAMLAGQSRENEEAF